MRALVEVDRQSQLIGRAQALREVGQALNRCLDDGSGLDGVLRWLRTAREELAEEIMLQKAEHLAEMTG